jgi:hypothetical protein
MEEIDKVSELQVAYRYRSECLLVMGRIREAIRVGDEGCRSADKLGSNLDRVAIRTILGSAYYHGSEPTNMSGVQRAYGYFSEAEKIQDDGAEVLYSVRGYRFCELLLERGEVRGVQRRALLMREYALQEASHVRRSRKVLSGIGKVDLGLSLLLLAIVSGKEGRSKASANFERAIDILRQSQRTEYLLFGLLNQAEFFLSERALARAKPLLDEVFTEATHDEMYRLITDCKICLARFWLKKGDHQRARKLVEEADDEVDQMHYLRQRPRVVELMNECQSI